MESKLKAAAQDSVGELPNLLLREFGYPHLPTTPIKQEPELTDWISGNLKPVRYGVYQRLFESGAIGYSCFYRGYWYAWEDTPEKAEKVQFVSEHQFKPWRGLSSNPNEVQS